MSGSIPSATLEALFSSLSTADIAAFVRERRHEDLTLDFKLASRNFDDREERKVIARAISGFANAAGGLIVWGIDARKDADGIDCAQAAVPLTDPKLFMTRLIEHGGAATSPVAPGVVHRLVEGTEGPFALTYVPESDRGPHMAKLGEDRYFQRSGDSFRVMEHFAIADMFGRRSRPVLKLRIQKDRNNSLLVLIANEGRGAAKSLYLGLKLPPNFRPSAYGYDGSNHFWLKDGGYSDNFHRFGGDTGTILHAGQTHPVALIDYTVIRPDGSPVIKGPQTVEYQLAAEDIPLETGTIVLDHWG
jgi:hypothetical protein